MAYSGGMLEKNLWIFLFGILVWFCPLSCWCFNLTSLNLRGMRATQGSNYLHQGVTLSANLAINGDLRTSVGDFSCAHSSLYDLHPWWKVDLGTNHCLGRITLVNRGDCCYERLSGAFVRAGIETNIVNNAACGSAVTSAQASIPGGHIPILCNPPVIARYVSVDDEVGAGKYKTLALCEVMVEEHPMEYCFPTTTVMTMGTSSCVNEAGVMSSLLFEGKCIINSRPLLVLHMKSPMLCFLGCKINNECWSYDYIMTSGQCRLYDVKAGDLKADDQQDCLVYVVVRG